MGENETNFDNYNFDAAAEETNAQPDWKAMVEIPSGTFEAQLHSAAIRKKDGWLAVVIDFKVQLPGEENPVIHTEFLTTHKDHQPTTRIGIVLSQLATLTGLPVETVKNAIIFSKNHPAFDALLTRKVGSVYSLEFVRGPKYLNVKKFSALS